jgi:ribosome-associated translation inhibitor RaiA
MIDVDLHVGDGVPRDQAEEARERLASLGAYTDEPVLSARLTLRRTGQVPPYAADASMLLDGRLLAAHATGRRVLQAADEVVERLRRQLLRVKGADVALRNEPRTIAAALRSLPIPDNRSVAQPKPPEEREIIRRRPYSSIPLSTVDAVAELLDLDVLFHLFLHARTDEWVVVHRRDDDWVGLIHPQGSVLADEGDIVVPQPSRYSEPLSLETARAEMDVLNHRFLYFTGADGRGRVLYLRHDGDYGLVEPE